jgi:hypothetical protein
VLEVEHDLPPRMLLNNTYTRVQVCGFSVQGSGFWVQRFRVQGSRFKVHGSGFRVQGSKVQGSRFESSLSASTPHAGFKGSLLRPPGYAGQAGFRIQPRRWPRTASQIDNETLKKRITNIEQGIMNVEVRYSIDFY